MSLYFYTFSPFLPSINSYADSDKERSEAHPPGNPCVCLERIIQGNSVVAGLVHVPSIRKAVHCNVVPWVDLSTIRIKGSLVRIVSLAEHKVVRSCSIGSMNSNLCRCILNKAYFRLREVSYIIKRHIFKF